MSPGRHAPLRPLRRALLIGLSLSGAAALGIWPARLHSQEEGASSAHEPASTTATEARAILYEDDLCGAGGGRFPGSITWNAEAESSGADRALEMVVRAGVTIPERGMTLRLSLRHSDDPPLGASHTIDLLFLLPPHFPHGGIRDIPAITMKRREEWRGDPLKAVAAKVSRDYFTFGLSGVEMDKKVNLYLLKEWKWFDVLIIYDDGKRAIMAFEKGPSGDRAFGEAFAVWDNPGTRR